MLLTFAVAVALGLFRWAVPQETLQLLRNIQTTTWLLLMALAVALALVAVTTTISTLHISHWRLGIVVSAISALLISWAVFSLSTALWRIPGDAHLFGAMILCTYVWLQLSTLLVRLAGYLVALRG